MLTDRLMVKKNVLVREVTNHQISFSHISRNVHESNFYTEQKTTTANTNRPVLLRESSLFHETKACAFDRHFRHLMETRRLGDGTLPVEVCSAFLRGEG